MDLNALRSELQKLSALVNDWDAAENISSVERDLALEKLRRIYDLMRFSDQVLTSFSHVEAEVPVNIDLDDVLSLGLIPDVGEDFEPEIQPLTAGDKEADSVTEPMPQSKPEVLSLTQPAVVGEKKIETGPAIASESKIIPESEIASEQSKTPVALQDAELVSGRDAESTPELDTNPVFEMTSASEPVVAPAPRPVLGSLFGMDDAEETAHHRRKQRVIMSLYGNDAPVSKFSGESESEDVFEEFSVETVKTISVSDTPADVLVSTGNVAPDDESYGGDEPAPEPPVELDDPDPDAPAEEAHKYARNTEDLDVSAAGAVLGEVINHRGQTLGETFPAHPDTLSEAAHRAPIGDLHAALGLNDRFLLIRDLFDSDAAACDAALTAFNGFDNLDDCMIHIAENYNWNPDCDGAKLLVELLERKYV